MSDRPAPPAQPPVLPPPPSGRPGQSGGPSGSSGNSSGSGDTAVRSGFAERIQAKLAAATSGEGRAAKEGKDGKEPRTREAAVRRPRPRGPRRARLRLTRVDPWSVMKTAFLLSIAFGIVTVVAVAMIWEVIGAAGVWTSINDTVKEVIDEPGTRNFDIEDYVGTDRVLGFTMLVAAVDVVLITAIATLGAFLYNMSAALLGGIEVTLAEDN